MKKFFLFIVSAVLLLSGCAKEKFSSNLGDGQLTEVTFTAAMQNANGTRAVADNDGMGAYVNRCIMEVYYGDELFTRMYAPVNDQKKASFTTQLVSNRTYTVAFWADHVEIATTEAGLQVDSYYNTRSADGLKAVALKGTYAGNIDARDAFAYCQDYTIAQGGGVFEATLRRPFAQINVITNDVEIVKKASTLVPDEVNLVIKNAFTSFNVVDAAPVATALANLTYTANIYSWDDTKSECTLSMDYLFADAEKAVIDIDWKAKKTGNADVTHSFAAVPYQKNYRTNIKGALLTTQGQWNVTVDPIWNTPDYPVDYVVAYNIADGNAKMAAGAHYVNVVEPNDADTVNVKIPNTAADNNDYGVAISGTPAGDSAIVRVEELGDKTGTLGLVGPQTTRFEINCPNLTVKLNGEKTHDYTSVLAATADSTLIVEKGVAITEMLTITKGTAYIYGNVADVTLDPIAPATASVSEWHVYDKNQFAKAIAINTPLIVLEKDIELTEAGIFASGTYTLDLNGHILSRETTGGGVPERGVLIVNGGKLSVYDNASAGGKIAGTSNGANNHAVTVNGGEFHLYSGTLESDYAGVYVLGGDTHGTFCLRGGEVNAIYGVSVQYNAARFNMFGGTINAKIGVTGNGTAGRGGTIIQLNKGLINGGNEAEDAGVYHPQSGTLYLVDDIVIKGSTAIEMKSGTDYYYSGNPTLESTNAVVSHNPNSNGVSTTGYSVALVNNPDYSGDAKASITLGRHYGPVAILDDDDDPDNNTAKMSISGGIFSIRPADEYLATGYAVIDNTDSQTKERYPFAIAKKKLVGSGTQADPFQLSSASDLALISQYSQTIRYYKLTSDIVTTGEEFKVSGQYFGKCLIKYLAGEFDGDGHKITFPEGTDTYMITDGLLQGTIKNLNIEFKEEGVVAAIAYNGSAFKNVNVSGKLLHFSGNCGAYVIYGFYDALFEDCTCSADITGKGGSGDYNAVFVGYAARGSGPYTFRNCTYSGKMVCGKSAMFIGNPCSYNISLNVENCKNAGIIISTYVAPGYKMNYYAAISDVGGSNNYGSFTVNGVAHSGMSSDNSWVPLCWEDPLVTTTGSAINGPEETGMVLQRNADKQFVVTPATGGVIGGKTVHHYEVSIGLYVGVEGGSSRQYATETITPDGSASYTTVMKDYKFVDRTYVGTGTIVKVGDNDTYTDGTGTYYVVGEGYTTGGHQPEAATLYSLSAFDENGVLLATANLTE